MARRMVVSRTPGTDRSSARPTRLILPDLPLLRDVDDAGGAGSLVELLAVADDPAQSTRLTVTAAPKTTFVRLVFAVETDSASVANPNLTVLENGEFVAGAARLEGGSSSTANGRWHFTLTAPLAVTAGDYFEGRFFLSTSGREVVASAHTFLAIEVLETSEAENPPEPVESFLAGTPPASSLVFKKAAARPFRLAGAGKTSRLPRSPAAAAALCASTRRSWTSFRRSAIGFASR